MNYNAFKKEFTFDNGNKIIDKGSYYLVFDGKTNHIRKSATVVAKMLHMSEEDKKAFIDYHVKNYQQYLIKN